MQTALVANGAPPQQNRTSHLTKLLKPCPASNKEFNCDTFHAIEGTYHLVNDLYFDTIAPQFSAGTRATILDVRPKELAKSSSSATTTSTGGDSATAVSTSTPVSSSTTTEPIYQHDEDDPVEDNDNDYEEDLSTGTLPPLLAAARTASTPIIFQQPAPQLSPSLQHVSTPFPLDSRSTALPIAVPLVSSGPSHSRTTSAGLPVPPTSTASTPFLTLTHPYSTSATSSNDPATGTTTVPPETQSNGVTENGSSSSSSSSHNGIADLSTSVSSLSALFSRRHSVRYLHSPQRKPKNNLVKTKSSFVLRIILHDRLAHHLANRSIDDGFLFFNVGTSFLWMDAKGKPKDPLSRIVFTKAYPTCHDVNSVTKSNEHLDVIIGFSSGDCVWYDPLTSKYFRLNKDGNMKRGAVTDVKWIPGSEDLFMASFSDGTMLVLDKDREDQAYTPTPSTTWAEQQFHATRPHKSTKYNPVSHWSANQKGIMAFDFSPDGVHLAVLGKDGTLRIINYHQERLLDIFTSYYGNFLCVAWSPDGRYLLTGGQDDLVTIWGFSEKRIVARCQGHRSWVTRVAFDPYRCDDKVYRFGSVGEDCKLILWDFSFSALHRPKNKHRTTPGNTPRSPRSPRSPKDTHRFSFVSADTMKHRTTLFDRHYNYDSITANENGPPPTLHQPPPSPPSPQQNEQPQPQRQSFGFRKRLPGSQQQFHRSRFSPPTKTDYLTAPFETYHLAMPTLHPAPNKSQVPLLQPSTSRSLHADPCVDLIFRQDCIVTTDRRGRIRTWGRP
ncbi:hypothetical protein [Absidia glauca]|uniref:Uncharacterized protein n=1 Tax=Absidia glauca TaxID=4829 RepID=A0A163LQK8_ABSGL|nr:hypothetical protein [Absidia glauca]